MQFYILHPDPIKSAQMLPDYALFKVNLREGWQILSDIGHIHGVTWEGQNKLYSASHALTRSLCSDRWTFFGLIDNYGENLREYFARKGKKSTWNDCFWRIRNNELCLVFSKLPKDKYESTRRYLMEYKTKHLTEEEKERLK